MRNTGGGHGEWNMHGIDTPGSATALVAGRYMDKYGANWEDLARIGIGYRENAAKNPIATLRNKPLTMDSYLQEPVIAGPFRRRDYLAVFGALSLILIPTGVFRSHRVRRWRRI
jgi:acetyl-CoA acetyltransferase